MCGACFFGQAVKGRDNRRKFAVNNAYIYRNIALGNGKIHIPAKKLDQLFLG